MNELIIDTSPDSYPTLDRSWVDFDSLRNRMASDSFSSGSWVKYVSLAFQVFSSWTKWIALCEPNHTLNEWRIPLSVANSTNCSSSRYFILAPVLINFRKSTVCGKVNRSKMTYPNKVQSTGTGSRKRNWCSRERCCIQKMKTSSCHLSCTSSKSQISSHPCPYPSEPRHVQDFTVLHLCCVLFFVFRFDKLNG